MRGLRSVCLARVLCLALGWVCGFPRETRAGVTVDLLFVGIDGSAISATNTVSAAPGDLLTMAVLFSNDEGLSGISLSLHYDLDGDDELDVAQQTAWGGVAINRSGTARFSHLHDLQPPTATSVGSFDGVVLLGSTLTLPPGTYQIGTVVWRANAGVESDGTDILSGFFRTGDGALGEELHEITGVLFRGATVNAVPEPATAGLLGLGLLALGAARRRVG
jgi:hypothetical protein